MTEMTAGMEAHPVSSTTPPPQLEEVQLAPDGPTAQPAKASLDEELSAAKACDLKTVDGIVGKARAIHDAKDKRDHKRVPVKEFHRFCEELYLRGAQASKWAQLGCPASLKRFEPKEIKSKLPPLWTTLWSLQRLTEAQWKKVRDSGKLNPKIKSREINAIVGIEPKKRPKLEAGFLTGELATEKIPDFINAVNEVAKKFRVKPKLTGRLAEANVVS